MELTFPNVIYGLCPVCKAWQMEVPYSTPLSWIEEAIAEHDAEDHPGELAAMVKES